MSFKQIGQMYKQIVVHYSAIKRNQSQWYYANWKPQKVIHLKLHLYDVLGSVGAMGNSSVAARGLRMGEGFDYKEAAQLFLCLVWVSIFLSSSLVFLECFPPVFYPLTGEPFSLPWLWAFCLYWGRGVNSCVLIPR